VPCEQREARRSRSADATVAVECPTKRAPPKRGSSSQQRLKDGPAHEVSEPQNHWCEFTGQFATKFPIKEASPAADVPGQCVPGQGSGGHAAALPTTRRLSGGFQKERVPGGLAGPGTLDIAQWGGGPSSDISTWVCAQWYTKV
jgi:hypothetical protein